METQSHDTNNSLGRLVGVEDSDGKAWCYECADREIRNAGFTAFDVDLDAYSARRKCTVCGRRIGEVSG